MLQNGELWALLGLILASEFLSDGVYVVCLFLITGRKPTGQTKQIVNVLNYSFVVEFVCKINESLS